MIYSIRTKGSAAKELARIPRTDRVRIVRAIDGLATEPLSGSALKGELRGLRRIRVGHDRVVYEVLGGELVVLVVRYLTGARPIGGDEDRPREDRCTKAPDKAAHELACRPSVIIP